MGLFRYPITIAPLFGGGEESLEALVDTGSTYTWVPRSVLARLGVEPREAREFILADGSIVARDVVPLRIRILGREVYTFCVFAEEDGEPLLGALALEEAMLAVDPVNKTLVPTRGYALTSVLKGGLS